MVQYYKLIVRKSNSTLKMLQLMFFITALCNNRGAYAENESYRGEKVAVGKTAFAVQDGGDL